MALTRTDENELLTALHEGLHETPLWRTFLDRLRRRMRADHVTLILGRGDMPMRHATTLSPDGHALPARLPYEQMRPGRVYSAEEVDAPGHGRFMRVNEPGGASAWAILMRGKEDFGAAEGAVLAALAPHLALALRNFAALERERFRADIAEAVLARAGIGWGALDADGRVTAASPGMRPLLAAGGTRLAAGSPEADRALQRAGEAYAEGRDRTPQAIRLDGENAADLLAMPVPERPPAAVAQPATLALVRIEPPLRPLHAALLAKLLDLSLSEAQLAVLLAQGRSIAEAAEMLRLTLETARNYSKRLYAKTGTRGQADLVRLVLTNVAMLA